MPTPEQQAEATAVLNAYSQVTQNLRATVLAQVLAIWDSLNAWRDPDIAAFVAQVVPQVVAGQVHTSALTAAYLNRAIAIESGQPLKAVAVASKDTTGAAVRNGVAPKEVYGRMGQTVYRALGEGADIDTAVKKARDRLTKTAQTDLQLSKTWASRAVLEKAPGIMGYRRVLTGVSSCALCVVASTQKYHKAALLPMHPGCDCTVAPLIGTEPLPTTIDRDALKAAHDEIKARLGVDTNQAARLRELTIVHDHGEIGPVLAVRDQHWMSPADIAA